jgi:nicotinate dehydrogenase subunit B
LPDMTDLVATLKANPDSIRPLKEVGDVDAVLSAEAGLLKVTYVWPYQMHGSIGPSCAVADYRDGTLTVWTGSQNPHLLHADLAVLLEMSQREIRVVRMEAAGCYGRNCADDASAEAALLSRAVGRPVRVQLMRDEEHVWEPKGTAQLLEVRGGLTKRNTLAYDFSSRYPSNNAPLLSLMQTGRLEPDPVVEHKGDRTAVPQYRIDDLRVVARDMPPIVRAAWMRGVSALPNVFAHESFIDEVAAAECADPIEFRLRFMEEPRAIALVKALASRAGWRAGVSPQPQAAGGKSGVVRGRGFAQHQYVHGTFPGVGSAWAAWVCDVEVDTASGVVRVLKVTVGYDCGLMVNPAGVYHQIHGNVIQSVSRVLKECVTFDHRGVTSREWGGYPIIPFSEIPEIDVLVMPADDHPPLGVGESASVPSAAAIANAIFSATGVRLREVPFTPARLRAALAAKA